MTAHGNSYDAVIPADTEFDEIGAVREGHVLRPTNKVITVGSGNVHEAYPVADAGRLVGFYLPFERAFAPAEPAIDFPLKERAQR